MRRRNWILQNISELGPPWRLSCLVSPRSIWQLQGAETQRKTIIWFSIHSPTCSVSAALTQWLSCNSAALTEEIQILTIRQPLRRKFKFKFLQFGSFYGGNSNSNSNSCNSAALKGEIQIQIQILAIRQLLWRKFKFNSLQFGSSYGGNSNSNSCSSAAFTEEIQIQIFAIRQLLWRKFKLKFLQFGRFYGGNTN